MGNLFTTLARGIWPRVETPPPGPSTPIQSFFINGWPEGWRADVPDTQQSDQMLSDVLNVDFSRDGVIKKRNGYVEITDAVTNLTAADHLIPIRTYTSTGLFPNFSQQLLHFNENDGELFYQSFGNILSEYNSPASGADFVDSGYGMGPASPSAANIFRVFPIVAIPFGDDIYITTLRYNATKTTTTYQDTTAGQQDGSGQSRPLKYDVAATTFTRLVSHQLDGTNGGIPRGRVGLAKHSRLMIGNVHTTGSRWPSRIYYSEITADGTVNPEVFTSTSYIDVNGDDGDEITAMASFGEQIIIFKNTSVWGLDGVDPTDFSLHPLESNLGTEASNCVIQHAGLLYFYDYRSGIWSYDGAVFNLLSEPINPELFADVNKWAAYKASSWIHNNSIYFSFPVGEGSTGAGDDLTRTYIWDLNDKTWTKYNYGAIEGFEYYTDYSESSGVIPSDTSMYIASPNGVEGIYQVNDTLYNDAGAAIAAHFTTGWLNPTNTDDRNRLRRLQTIMESTASGDVVTVQVYRDFNETTPWVTISQDPTGGTVYDYHDTTTNVGFFTWIKLKFSNAVVDEDMRVRGVGMSISTKPTPRGSVGGTNYTP